MARLLMSGRHDVTLMTSFERGKAPVADQFPGLRTIEWTEPEAFRRFGRFNSMLKPGYIPFYLKAGRWIRNALISGERFDIAPGRSSALRASRSRASAAH